MVMDYIGDQEKARTRTGRLVVLFMIAVVGIVAMVYATFAFGIMLINNDPENPIGFWQPQLLLITTSLTLGVILVGSLVKTAQLAGGGKAVASALGGTLVHPDTSDPRLKRLINVVEEMSIASGCPVPPVYLIDDPSINAFAAGFTVDNAVIGVTTGCVLQLNRDELQGVMAHEFSHIVHGDMRLNIRITGMIFGIMAIGFIGWILFRFIGPILLHARGGEKNPGPIIGLALMVAGLLLMAIGSIGTLVSRLIQAAVSRQREFLADAAAVDYTRNPDGIAGALRRIGGVPSGNRMNQAAASEFEHFFFTPALATAFATHPPLPTRIARIENREEEEVSEEFQESKREIGRQRIAAMEAGLPADTPPPPPVSAAASMVSGMAEGVAAGAAAGAAPANWRTRPASRVRESLSHLGDATPDHLAYARTLISLIPEPIQQSVHDTIGARAVCLILLVSGDSEVRKTQSRILQEELDEPTRHEVSRMANTVRKLVRDHPEVRLVLVDMAMPALERMEKTEIRTYMGLIESMVHADGRLDRFEWLLGRLLRSHFDSSSSAKKGSRGLMRPLRRLSDEARLVLAMIAWSGTRDEAQARRAFMAAAGAAGLGDLVFPSRSDCSVSGLDEALNRLQSLRFRDRARLLDAAVEGVFADGHATIEEVEILRALSAAIACPMPPVLPS